MGANPQIGVLIPVRARTGLRGSRLSIRTTSSDTSGLYGQAVRKRILKAACLELSILSLRIRLLKGSMLFKQC